jgi:hypothetical protein
MALGQIAFLALIAEDSCRTECCMHYEGTSIILRTGILSKVLGYKHYLHSLQKFQLWL